METIPALPGAYALQLTLPRAKELKVGRLGEVHLPAGEYIYMGSACGSGGLRARLGRHLAPAPPNCHWHIDYLHSIAQASAYCYLLYPGNQASVGEASISPAVECLWSQALAALPGASVPVHGFGTSDCRRGCRAHLVAFPPAAQAPIPLLATPGLRDLIAQSACINPDALVCVYGRNRSTTTFADNPVLPLATPEVQ